MGGLVNLVRQRVKDAPDRPALRLTDTPEPIRAEPLTPGRRRRHIRMIVAKCSSDSGADYLLEQACEQCEAITQIGALHRLTDDKLLALHREIDVHRECVEHGHTPHGFVRAWQ